MAVVIAVDAGTTGVRAMAVTDSGEVVGRVYTELSQHYPRPGWVEHDPIEIRDAVDVALAALQERLEDQRHTVATIGITNQRETVVAWDRRTGRPLHRAIVWQDRRTAATCDRLRDAGHLPLVRRTTGLVLDPYFSATKLAWLLHVGGVEVSPHLALGTVDAWLVWNLTGGPAGGTFATDPSNASRTLLYDITSLAWSPELCDLFGVPQASLPEVRPSSGRFGTTHDGVPVSGVAGDQQAALVGQACVRPGMAKATFGTGTFVLLHAGDHCPEPVDGLLTSVAWVLGDGQPAYALEGSVFVTGAAVQWLRGGLGLIDTAGEVEALAASVPDAGGVVVVPAFAGLGSPWWDATARGAIVGLSATTTAAHLARAVLESIAHQTSAVTDAMAAAGGPAIDALRVDGGAAVNDLLLQLVADQCGVAVERPRVTETTAAGAAFLAGLAEGVWTTLDDVAGAWAPQRTFEPAISRSRADAHHAAWLQAVDRARGWAAGPDERPGG